MHCVYKAESCLGGGSAARTSFSAFRVHFSELVDSLEELLSVVECVGSLGGSAQINGLIVEGLQQIILRGKSVRDCYKIIEEDARRCDLFLLTDGEYSKYGGQCY